MSWPLRRGRAWRRCVAQRPAGALPRVHFVATGGTISNRDGGRLTAAELAKSMPGVERFAELTHEQFTNVASSELTLKQWVGLSKRVNEVFAGDKDLAGIVVTSGTDTLEETAFFLHLTVRDPRPVVVVGSMRNPSTVGYEGAANLLEGVRVAADPQSRDKGVLVVLNDEINSARNVTKTDALRLQTFRSRDYGQLGVVDRDRVVFFNQITQAAQRTGRIRHQQGHRAAARGRDHGLPGCARRLDQGGGGQRRQGDRDRGGRRRRHERHAERGARVCGVERRLHRDQHEDRQRPHCAAPRGDAAGVQAVSRNSRRRRQFTIAGEDHVPVKARVLLMVALTKTTDRNELQRIFSEY